MTKRIINGHFKNKSTARNDKANTANGVFGAASFVFLVLCSYPGNEKKKIEFGSLGAVVFPRNDSRTYTRARHN